MYIRPYHPDDDDALIALERQSPRGFPRPFVHFRRRFVDRAEMYAQHLTLVTEMDGAIVGVSSISLKDTLIQNQAVKVAYTFDVRVHPSYRRQGIGHAMVEEQLTWAKAHGATGLYALVVTTNQASIGMMQKSGYHKSRMIMYLQYQPIPLFTAAPYTVYCESAPFDKPSVEAVYGGCDLYVPDVAERVADLDFERWYIDDTQQGYAALSLYNQSRIYCQIDADAPWPRTPQEIERLGRNVQIFDVVGSHNKTLMRPLFDWVRDAAVAANVNKLVWLVDRADPIPSFLLDEASTQIDYWLMFRAFDPAWQPQWTEKVYLDPRDL